MYHQIIIITPIYIIRILLMMLYFSLFLRDVLDNSMIKFNLITGYALVMIQGISYSVSHFVQVLQQVRDYRTSSWTCIWSTGVRSITVQFHHYE
jgi:hypothetical protein